MMTITPAAGFPQMAAVPPAPPAGPLPMAASVLVVTARPGPESEDLGGLLYAFRRAGTTMSLLCLTRGEAAPRNSAATRLEAIRPWELQLACSVLGIFELAVANYPDGGLDLQPGTKLIGRVRRAIRQHRPDLLLVIAPEAGGRDDVAVARAVRTAAAQAGLPVVARTWPDVRGAWRIWLGADAAIARAIQKSAAAAHASQSEALPALVRRLDLLDDTETVRWLLPPRPVPPQRVGGIVAAAPRPRTPPAAAADFP